MKNNKKYKKRICEQKVAFFFPNTLPLTRDVTFSKLQRQGENIGDRKLSAEHALNKRFRHLDEKNFNRIVHAFVTRI